MSQHGRVIVVGLLMPGGIFGFGKLVENEAVALVLERISGTPYQPIQKEYIKSCTT